MPTLTTPRLRRGLALAALATLALAGCAADEPTNTGLGGDAEAAADETSGGWPRTVEVNGEPVTLDAPPERIVALSTETGDLGLALVGHERFAAVSNGSVTEGAGNELEEAQQVATALPPGTNPDPETILALEPDLVLLTGRHSGEQEVAGMLEESGVPTATFESGDFSTPDEVIASLGELGSLLGAEDAAQSIADRIQEQVDETEALVAGAESAPRTLVLFARGGNAMLMAQGSATTELVELAGGTSIATEQGWAQALPADPEAIIAAAPDVILVQDFQAQGLAPFAELLDNPALAEVPAIAGDGVHLVDAQTTSGTAGARIGEGLAEIAALLHPELAA